MDLSHNRPKLLLYIFNFQTTKKERFRSFSRFKDSFSNP